MIRVRIMLGLIALFLFWGGTQEYQKYNCMTKHYPDQFVEIEMIKDFDYDKAKSDLLDYDKAIYDCHYIYDNVIYRREMSDKEFDDKFYICPHNPKEEYSESDIAWAKRELVTSILFFLIAGVLMLGAIAGGKKESGENNK